MNPLALFALAITRAHEREAERALLIRRGRLGDDDPRAVPRDRRWAAAIHRWAVVEPDPGAAAAERVAPESAPGRAGRPFSGDARS